MGCPTIPRCTQCGYYWYQQEMSMDAYLHALPVGDGSYFVCGDCQKTLVEADKVLHTTDHLPPEDETENV